MENITLKVKKLLALSKSSNEHESQNAMMMAQRLLIKYKLSLREVEDYSERNVNVDKYRTNKKFRGASWKSNLANIIAKNFGCYMYLETDRTHEICFYGKEDDMTICNIMLNYAIKSIDTNGDKLIKKMKQDRRRKYFKGIKSDYALGFIKGLDERFKEQVKENEEWGLVLQKEQIVIDRYKDFSRGFSSVNVSQDFYKYLNAFDHGRKDGNEFDISNKIENDGKEEKLIAL